VRAVRSGSSRSSDPGLNSAAGRAARAGCLVLGLLIAGALADSVSGQTITPSDTGYPTQFCLPPSAGLSIDHVVVAVSGLPAAEADFRSLGFVLKPGRRHENGLRNAHIKFPDGSGLELMTVEGRATDRVASEYAGFLAGGEGAAFVAIEADLGKVEAAAEALGLGWQTHAAGSYSWLTLADSTPAFFIDWSRRPSDPDSLTAHSIDVSGISSVRLTATAGFGRLLGDLGAAACPTGSGLNSPGAVAGRPIQTIQLLDRSAARFEVRAVTLEGGPCEGARTLDSKRTHGVEIVIAPRDSRVPEAAVPASPGPDGLACGEPPRR